MKYLSTLIFLVYCTTAYTLSFEDILDIHQQNTKDYYVKTFINNVKTEKIDGAIIERFSKYKDAVKEGKLPSNVSVSDIDAWYEFQETRNAVYDSEIIIFKSGSNKKFIYHTPESTHRPYSEMEIHWIHDLENISFYQMTGEKKILLLNHVENKYNVFNFLIDPVNLLFPLSFAENSEIVSHKFLQVSNEIEIAVEFFKDEKLFKLNAVLDANNGFIAKRVYLTYPRNEGTRLSLVSITNDIDDNGNQIVDLYCYRHAIFKNKEEVMNIESQNISWGDREFDLQNLNEQALSHYDRKLIFTIKDLDVKYDTSKVEFWPQVPEGYTYQDNRYDFAGIKDENGKSYFQGEGPHVFPEFGP